MALLNLELLESLDSTLRRRRSATTLSQSEAMKQIHQLLELALEEFYAAIVAGDLHSYERALRVFGALARFLWMRGLTRSVGIQAADAAMKELNACVSSSCDTQVIDRARYGASQIYYAAAAYDQARSALASLVSAELSESQADALNQLGMIEREQGRYVESRQLHQRARDLYRKWSDIWGEAHAISNLAVCAYRSGDSAGAVSLHQEALKLRRSIDDTLGIGSSLGNLALLYTTTGRPHQARPLYAESLALRESLGDGWGIAGSCVALAAAELACGSSPTYIIPLLLRASQGFESVGDQLGFAETAEVSASVLLAAGERQGAAYAFGAASGARQQIQAPVPASHRAHHEMLNAELAELMEQQQSGAQDGRAGIAAPLREALTSTLAALDTQRNRRSILAWGLFTMIGAGVGVLIASFLRKKR